MNGMLSIDSLLERLLPLGPSQEPESHPCLPCGGGPRFDALAGNRIRSTATRTWPVASIWDVDSVWHCSRRCQRSHSLARYAPAHSASVPPSQSWECFEMKLGKEWNLLLSGNEESWMLKEWDAVRMAFTLDTFVVVCLWSCTLPFLMESGKGSEF